MYRVTAPGARARLEEWIRTRGGVLVWPNINMSNPDRGDIYTPALMANGQAAGKPHWSCGTPTLVTSMDCFEFVELVEVKRFHVGVRMGGQGMCLKLTDGATRRLRKECAKWPDSHYEFDYMTQEAVILAPKPGNNEGAEDGNGQVSEC